MRNNSYCHVFWLFFKIFFAAFQYQITDLWTYTQVAICKGLKTVWKQTTLLPPAFHALSTNQKNNTKRETFNIIYYLCSMISSKKALLGMTLNELKEACKQLGMPAFTGGQIAKWLYTHHVKHIDEMTNISKTCLLYTSDAADEL